ncbi:cell wall-binding repeat-containing protein [Rossellomorea vietnamensis]|uniref:cell wall-binding repeat-containing protein n=1 Tax=Rossellomorea vietnamensis TaxID=218284 RepID=UPI003CF21AEA
MKKKLLGSLALSMGLLMMASPSGASAEKRVVIDPGHGGRHTGTCGLTGNITRVCERDVNLLVSLKLQSLLEDKGYDVRMTRESDVDFSRYISGTGGDLDMRMRYANGLMKDNNDQTIFISMHHNGHPRYTSVKGTETYYYDGLRYFDSRWPHDPLQIEYLPDSKRLAEAVHPNMVTNLKTQDRGIHADEAFYVIRNAQSPSVLLELGYMTNAEEEARIKTNDFQWAAARAITSGIDSYYEVYEVYNEKNDRLTVTDTKEEAIRFADKQNQFVTVFDKENQKVVYDNEKYTVYIGNDGSSKGFYSYDQALSYAKKNVGSYIYDKNAEWVTWSNAISPIYSVYQSNTKKKDYFDYKQALYEAQKLTNSKVVRKDSSEVVWTNIKGQSVVSTPTVKKLIGSGRVETSVEVSKSLYPNGFAKDKEQKVVILATGFDSADGLSAGPLSAVYGEAPILLSDADGLKSTLKSELSRLGAEKVIMIGGNAALSANVEKGIHNMGIATERIKGSDRYETNRAIISKLGNVNGYFVASGYQFADALSVAPIAAANDWAVVLADKDSIQSSSLSLLKGKPARVVGGTAVISSEVEKSIKGVTSNVKRLSGATRYKTLSAVLWEFKDKINTSEILLSTGQDFPDALSSAPLAIRTKAPLIITGPEMDQSIKSVLMSMSQEQRIKNVKVVGGTLDEDIIKDTTYLVK